MKNLVFVVMLLSTLLLTGCGEKDTSEVSSKIDGDFPVFRLATSEYPSWTTYVVAAKAGLINPDEGGEMGTFETEYGVDVILEVKDYDPCIVAYGSGSVDAVCITNIDVMNSSTTRASTMIMPTSTSAGGDQGLSVVARNFEELKGVTVYGLDNSVSEYTHHRAIQKAGFDPKDFSFEHLDTQPAATALQTSNSQIKAICVWNPLALETRNKNPDVNLVYSSKSIAGEIIDGVVVGNDSLAREGGERFAECLCAIQYEVNKRMTGDTADVTISALKDDFAPSLTIDDMKNKVLEETKFYSTPKEGIAVFGPDFKQTMKIVVETAQAIGILESGKQPTMSFDGSEGSDLTFTTKYMKAVQ